MKRYLTNIDIKKANIIKTDVAIIGSGLAGLYAVYNLDKNLDCTIFA
jgi:predicted NAD/FAD-binding protein